MSSLIIGEEEEEGASPPPLLLSLIATPRNLRSGLKAAMFDALLPPAGSGAAARCWSIVMVVIQAAGCNGVQLQSEHSERVRRVVVVGSPGV
jgi:hypothetical protein